MPTVRLLTFGDVKEIIASKLNVKPQNVKMFNHEYDFFDDSILIEVDQNICDCED